jgi:hypothetical protein
MNGRTVTIAGQVFKGVRSDVVVTPGSLKQGGMQKARAWSIVIPIGATLPNMPSTYAVKDGMEVTDDIGKKYKVLSWSRDAIQTTLTCGSLYGGS